MDINAQPNIGIKPLLSLRRHFRVSVIVFIFTVLAGLPVAWIKGESKYTAEAVFQVSPRYMKNLESDKEVELQSNQQYREMVNHYSKSVLRYDILKTGDDNLKAKGIDLKPKALTQREYIELLQTKLIYVKPILDTYMVRVGIEGGSKERPYLHEQINSIMAAFLETSKVEQIYGSETRLNILQDTEKKLLDEVATMERERFVLAEKLGLTTFNERFQNPYDALYTEVREKYSKASLERAQAESIYKIFITKKEIPTEIGPSLLQMRLADLGLNTLRTEVTRRVEALTQAMNGLSDKHPARIAALSEIKDAQENLKNREEAFDQQAFNNFKIRFEAVLNQKTLFLEESHKKLQQLESQSAEVSRAYNQAMKLTKEIEDREERIKKIKDRLGYIESESIALGFVRLVTPALPADIPTGIGKTKIMIVIIIAAFMLAMTVPLGIDMLDPRIRSVNEAEKLMGMQAAGWQIRREDLPTQLFSNDQIRRFTSSLIRNRARHNRKTFAFTAVKAGGGTTTTILDSAKELQKLGARVLVVEANTFAPFADFSDLHPGLTDYLSVGAGLEHLPHAFKYQDTSLEVVGIGGSRASGLQRLDLFKQAQKMWEEQYDYLLYDLPPILLGADTEMLVEALGQVFLVVEADSVLRGEVIRAKSLLQKIDPDAVGLFVNSVSLFRGGGYMKDLIIESITREKVGKFKTSADWKLQWQMFRARWSNWRSKRK